MAEQKTRHVVVIKDGELLPIQKGSPCLRMGSIAKALVTRGDKVTWLATTWSHQFKAKISDEGLWPVGKNYDVQLLECGSYKGNISIARIRHHVKFGQKTKQWLDQLEIKPDLIVCAYPIPSVAAAAAAYCQLHSIPFVMDVRDLWPDVFTDKLGKIGSVLAAPLISSQTRDLAFALGAADIVVAVSEKYLSWAKDHGAKIPKRKIYKDVSYFHFPIGAEAIDLTCSKPAGEFATLLEPLKDKTFFSFLGSFGKSYDLDLIVAAGQHFAKMGADDVHFLVAGDGEQRPLIEEAAKSLGNITYCGWLNADNTKAFLAVSDVGVMPLQSVSGTFPNKPFQYMAAGLPIISSLVGEFADFVEHEKVGINFQQGDADGFIRAIDQLRDNKLRSAMSAQVIRLFNAKFEQNVIYSEFASLLQNLMR